MRFLHPPKKFWTVVFLVAVGLAGVRFGAAWLEWRGYARWQLHQDNRDRLEARLWESLSSTRGKTKAAVLDYFRSAYPNWKLAVADGELQSLRDPDEEVAVALYYYNYDGERLLQGRVAWLAVVQRPGWLGPLRESVILFDKFCYFFFLPFGLIVLLSALVWRPARFSGGRVCTVIGLVGLCLWAAMTLSGGAFSELIWIAPAAVLTLLGLVLRRWGRPKPVDPRYCPHCTYDLTGNESGVCPECGHPTPATERRQVDARLQEAEDRLRSLEDDAV